MRFIALLASFLWQNMAFAQEQSIFELPDHLTGQGLSRSAYFIEDENHSLDFESFRLTPIDQLTPNQKDSLGFGFKASTYWIRFSIKNPKDHPRNFTLKLDYPLLDELTIYEQGNHGEIKSYISGDSQPFSHRPIDYRNFTFPISIEANELKTFYVKVRSTSTLTIPFQVWNTEILKEEISNEKAILGMYYGCVVAILLYNLFILASTRSRSYFYYCAFLATSITFYLAWTGLGNQYLWGESQYLTQRMWPLAGSMLALTIFGFQYYFLNIRESLPKLANFYWGLGILNGIFVILNLFIPLAVAQKLGFFSGASCSVLCYGVAVFLTFKGNRQAAFYTIAWSVFLGFILFGALATLGVIGGGQGVILISSFGSLIGSALESILLSIGLGDRINIMKRKELEQSQKIIENLTKIQVLKDRLEAALSATKQMSEFMSKSKALDVVVKHICNQLAFLSIEQVIYFERELESDSHRPVNLFALDGVTKLTAPLHGSLDNIKIESKRVLVPIKWKDHDFGILAIHLIAEVEKIPEEELWFIETMMQSLALTLQNIYFQDNLKDLVDERTADLNKALDLVTERQHKVDDILQNIEQGIFTFDKNFNLGQEYSQHLLEIFDIKSEDMEQLTIDKLLFKNIELSSDKRESAYESIKSSVDVEEYLWEANTHHLPKRLDIRRNGGSRFVDLDWKPLVHGDDIVDQVMVVAKDVTSTLALESKLAEAENKKKKFMQTLSKLMSVDKRVLDGFFSEIQKNIAVIKNSLESQFNETFTFRSLHTMKGLCRSLKFDDLSEAIHETEGVIVNKSKNIGVDNSEFTSYFNIFVEKFQNHFAVYDQVFGVHVENLNTWNLIQFVSQVLPERLEGIRKSGYPMDWIKCSDFVFDWNIEVINELRDILIHLFNNSIDHGYLIPYENASHKKPIQLNLISQIKGDQVCIVLEDHGAGVNTDRLVRKAESLGIEYDISNPLSLIFFDGISTAKKATMSSGRGVGMAAVKSKVDDLGGTITLENKDSGGTTVMVSIPSGIALSQSIDKSLPIAT